MNTKLIKTKKGTAHLESIVTKEEIDLEKNHVVDEMIKTVSVKGFRQGKAPKAIAQKSLDPEKLSDHILNHVISHLLEHAVEENRFRLLGRPVLEELKVEKDGGWLVKIQLPLYPDIKLGDYSKYLKKKKSAKKEKAVEDVYQTLLDNEKVDISEHIINEEVNFSLERLSTQAKSLNLPMEEYLKALGKNLDQVKKEYRDSADKSVRLDLILLEIAKKENIDTTNEELLELAKVSNIPAKQMDQLRSIMNRRKTIDYLMKI